MRNIRPGHFLRTTAKLVVLPALGLAAGLGAAAVTTASVSPTYQATASVIILPTPAKTSDAASLGDLSLAQNLVSSVAGLAQSRQVTVAVAAALHLPEDQVTSHLTGASEPGTQIVTVVATAVTGGRAAAIANAATVAVIQVANRLRLGGTAVAISPLDSAGVPGTPIAPRPLLNSALGAFVGLLVGIGLMTLRSRGGHRFRRVAEIESELGLPAIGVIDRRTPRRFVRSAARMYADAEIGSAVDSLISTLGVLAWPAPGRRILISSVGEEESAAFVASLLAAGLGSHQQGTTLLEAKLSRTLLKPYFPDQGTQRVEDVLGRQRSPQPGERDAWLSVLTIDDLTGYFDGSPRFEQVGALIDTLVSHGDDVIVTAPRVLSGRGLTELSRHADVVILTIDSDRVQVADAGRAALLVQRLGVPLAGIVVTGTAASEDGRQPSAWPVVPAQRGEGDPPTEPAPEPMFDVEPARSTQSSK